MRAINEDMRSAQNGNTAGAGGGAQRGAVGMDDGGQREATGDGVKSASGPRCLAPQAPPGCHQDPTRQTGASASAPASALPHTTRRAAHVDHRPRYPRPAAAVGGGARRRSDRAAESVGTGGGEGGGDSLTGHNNVIKSASRC